jgi:hypothetical protein
MTSTHTIQEVVMRRVERIHRLRPLLSRGVASFAIFVAALFAIGREVWVAKVFQNMPSMMDVLAFTRFAEAAFLNTRFIVQVLIVVAVAALIWLARELVRYVASAVRTPNFA